MAERDWQAWVKKHANNVWRVVIVLLFLGLAIWAITLVYLEEYQGVELVIANSAPGLWLTAALTSVGPELAGIVIGVVTIDYLNERRQDEQLKDQLILQMRSSHNDVTDTAITILRARGWLSDGSLGGAILVEANLSGAKLWEADLNRAALGSANLSGAHLSHANLSGAKLWEADLSGAHLPGVDLSDALLARTNLSGATMAKANISRAILGSANLSEANLSEANLSEAILGRANLSGAFLMKANLSETHLLHANLSGANMLGVNLNGVKKWTIDQLEQADHLDTTIMPDGVQLGGVDFEGSTIEGPTFEEWKAQFLAKSDAEKAEAGWDDAGNTEPAEGA